MQPQKRQFSMAGKLALLLFVAMLGAAALAALLIDWLDNALLGASLAIRSAPGAGTTIELEVECDSRPHR